MSCMEIHEIMGVAGDAISSVKGGEACPPQPKGFPPGHFYSPIPSVRGVWRDRERIFALPHDGITDVNLNDAAQCRLLKELGRFHDEMPFTDEKQEGWRYFFRNPAFSYGDATVLYAMIRHLGPRRITEVGCGYSSCVTLDVNERFFDGAIQCTFVEPYPELLRSLLKPGDEQRSTLMPRRLQEVETARFADLDRNDILFVDSTHVSKIDSDVNHLFFRILPSLNAGVVIHLHDIFYPFEYPKGWIYEGRAWTENYLLRAFLQHNAAYEVMYFNHYMYLMHRGELGAALPTCLRNPGGSFWMRKR